MIKTNGSKAKLVPGLRPKKSSFAFGNDRLDDPTGKTKIKHEIERRMKMNTATFSIIDKFATLSKDELKQRKLEAVVEINQLSTQLSLSKLPKELSELLSSEQAFDSLLEGFYENISERIQLEKKPLKLSFPAKRGKGESTDKRRDSHRKKSHSNAKSRNEDDPFKRHEQFLEENARQMHSYFDLLGKIPSLFQNITKEFQFQKKLVESELLDLLIQHRKHDKKFQTLQQSLADLQQNLREKNEHINCLHLIIDRLVEENPSKHSQFLRTHGVNSSSKVTACSPKNEQSDFLFNPIMEKIKSCPRIKVNIFSEKRKESQRSSSNTRKESLPLDTHKENKSVQMRASSFKELNPAKMEKTRRRESVKPSGTPLVKDGSYEAKPTLGLSQQKLKIFKNCNRKFPSFLEATRLANHQNQLQKNKSNVVNIQNFDLLSERQQSMTRRYSNQMPSGHKEPKAFYFKKDGYLTNPKQAPFNQYNSEFIMPKIDHVTDPGWEDNLPNSKFFSPVSHKNFHKGNNIISNQEITTGDNKLSRDARLKNSKASKLSEEYGVILRNNRSSEKPPMKEQSPMEAINNSIHKEFSAERKQFILIQQQFKSIPSNIQVKEPPIAPSTNVDYDQNPLHLCDNLKHTPSGSFQNTERHSLVDFEAAQNLFGSDDLLPEQTIPTEHEGFDANDLVNISFKNFKKDEAAGDGNGWGE
jgi:hypothetical protein